MNIGSNKGGPYRLTFEYMKASNLRKNVDRDYGVGKRMMENLRNMIKGLDPMLLRLRIQIIIR
jgi:hypothetical protein